MVLIICISVRMANAPWGGIQILIHLFKSFWRYSMELKSGDRESKYQRWFACYKDIFLWFVFRVAYHRRFLFRNNHFLPIFLLIRALTCWLAYRSFTITMTPISYSCWLHAPHNWHQDAWQYVYWFWGWLYSARKILYTFPGSLWYIIFFGFIHELIF